MHLRCGVRQRRERAG